MNKKNQATWQIYIEEFYKQAKDKKFSEKQIVACLKYAENLYFQGLPIIFDGNHLSDLVGYDVYYVFASTNAKNEFYRNYKIPKRNGKTRIISEPLPSLKEIQRWILDNILIKIRIHPAAKAYIKDTSIIDNARFHKSQSAILKMDIKDFFPSIRTQYVNAVFKRIGYSQEVAKLLTELVTYSNCLPQGAPTSPALSNIIMYKADKRILGYAISKGLRYTRYADDLTISGDFNPAEVISFLEMVILETGFKVNREKTRAIKKSSRQLVTGVVVNEKLQIPKETRKRIRQELYYIKKYGLDSHLRKKDIVQANYASHLMGLASHVLQINPKDRDARSLIQFFSEDYPFGI